MHYVMCLRISSAKQLNDRPLFLIESAVHKMYGGLDLRHIKMLNNS